MTEYNRKEHYLELCDCEFEKEDTLDALHKILKPALANTKLQIFTICMTDEQYEWYKKQLEKENKNVDGVKLTYEGREVLVKDKK